MSRNDSLRYELRSTLLPEIKNQTTKRSYKRAIDRFSEWAKENGLKHLKDVSTGEIQSYERSLEEDSRGYSPATIHGYLAPICKASSVPMDRIQKPRRTALQIRRGRNPEANQQGQKEENNPKYRDCIKLQKCLGIRRNELKHLSLSDWDGTYVTVKRGKGGKRQRQWVLPEDRKTVTRIFAKHGWTPQEKDHPDSDDPFSNSNFNDLIGSQRLFSEEEIPSKANLHGLRAAHALRAYEYFLKRLNGPNGASEAARMRSVLVRRFEKSNQRLKKADPQAYENRFRKFKKDMDDRPYLLRGDNLRKADTLGLPNKYNRLSLMMVSVFELSHWRLDVTVVNYMIQ